MNMHKTCQLHRVELEVKKMEYANGRIALQLFEVGDFEPYMVATVNLPELPLEEGEVFIKDYSENEGIFEALLRAGIIEFAGKMADNGYVKVPVCRVLI